MRKALSPVEVAVYVGTAALFGLAHVSLGAPYWLLAVVFGCGVLAVEITRERWRRKSSPRLLGHARHVPRTTVAWDDTGITATVAAKSAKTVAWGDVIALDIHIVNEGFVDVPQWRVSGLSGQLEYPSDAIGNEGAIDAFKRCLAGFHDKSTYMAISQAMVATSGTFPVWKRTVAAQG